MRGFGVTAMDFAIECQMDRLAELVDMDPMEFRILNAYRDGDMKAHRREAKNTALVECVQVAAEKAKWPIREEFRRASSRQGVSAPPPRREQQAPPRPSYEPSPRYEPTPPAPAPTPAHGAARFSSVFGTRRR
jgi:anti-sigma factor RsiW